MRMKGKLVNFLRMPGLIGICLSAFVSIGTTNAAMTWASDGAGVESPVPPPAPALAPSATTTMPVPAPALSAGSRYVKQMAVMDTLPTQATAAGSNSGKPAAPDLKNDLALVSSLAVAGWEGLDPLKLSLSRNSLVTPGSKPVEEVQGKPASILIEYGCTEVVSRRFRSGQRYCEISLFRFAKPDGAYGAYTTMRGGSSTVVVRGQGSSEDDDSISFFSGNALVYLHSTSDSDDEAKAVLGNLGDQIAAHLSGGPPVPRLILSLPHMDRLAGSERFFMGSQSANRYGNIQFPTELLLDQSCGAACADYLYPRPRAERLKLLVAEYGNQSIAQNAFNLYSATMSSFSHKTLDKSGAQILCKMSDSYLMCGISGARVWIISGAKRASSPGVLAGELVSN